MIYEKHQEIATWFIDAENGIFWIQSKKFRLTTRTNRVIGTNKQWSCTDVQFAENGSPFWASRRKSPADRMIDSSGLVCGKTNRTTERVTTWKRLSCNFRIDVTDDRLVEKLQRGRNSPSGHRLNRVEKMDKKFNAFPFCALKCMASCGLNNRSASLWRYKMIQLTEEAIFSRSPLCGRVRVL